MFLLRLTFNLLRKFSYYSEISNIKSSVFSILKKIFPETPLQPYSPRHISAALVSQTRVNMCLYNQYVMESGERKTEEIMSLGVKRN